MLLIGIAWALFVAAMMTQGVLSAPLSERILHGGAVGYGWLNAGWAVGAFVSVFYASGFIRRHGANRSVTLTMAMIAASLFLLPVSRWLAVAVTIYFVMGSSRGVGGIALSSEMMQLVPRHFMGRVQNAFSFLASALQICTALLVGEAAHRDGLIYGFWMVGAMYLGAALAAWLPVRGMAGLGEGAAAPPIEEAAISNQHSVISNQSLQLLARSTACQRGYRGPSTPRRLTSPSSAKAELAGNPGAGAAPLRMTPSGEC